MTIAISRTASDQSHRTVRRALCHAPIGAHGTVEASLAWRQLRPGRAVSGRAAARDAARHLPIALTPHDEVAARLARLLTGVTWAVVTGDGASGLRVEVPRDSYNRVVRMMTAVWRQTRLEFIGGVGDPGVAAAMWRMAMLIDGMELRGERHWLPTALPSTAEVLVRAARVLRVEAASDTVYGNAGVVLEHSSEVRRLLSGLV
jgi:hypothetical protein